MYLNEAELTPEFQECILAYNPENIEYDILPEHLAYYLSCIQKLVGI